MRTPSLELFELIKSLGQTEKRYFRVFASMHGGDKNYLKLFDAMEKQKIYNEDDIKKQFKNEKFIDQLTATKNYLYHLILKSLRNYHAEDSMEMKLKSLLMDVEVLYGRGLFGQVDKLLAKGMKLAMEYDQHILLMEILFWKEKAMGRSSYLGKTQEDIDENFISQHNAVKKLENYLQYRKASSHIFWFSSRSGKIMKSVDLEPYKKIINQPIFKDEKQALSYSALLNFNQCHFIYYFIQQNYAKAKEYISKAVLLMESAPHHIKDNPKTYLVALSNQGACQFFLKSYKELKVTVEKLKELYDFAPGAARMQTMIWCVNAELNIYIHSGEIEEGLKLIKRIEKEISDDKLRTANVTEILTGWYSFALFFFVAKKYSGAITYLNKIINAKEYAEIRSDIYRAALVLRLLINYERGDQDLVEYSVRTTYKHLYKRKNIYKFENSLLTFIREKMSKINTNEEQLQAFKKLKNELAPLVDDPFESKAFEYFDMIAWLDSKIKNQPFGDVLKEKAVTYFS
jgi:hypothetical protein